MVGGEIRAVENNGEEMGGKLYRKTRGKEIEWMIVFPNYSTS